MTITNILLASGKGDRFDSTKPKQLAKFRNNTIFMHALNNILKCAAIDNIVITVSKDTLEEIKDSIKQLHQNHKAKIMPLVMGGAERSNSVYNALKFISQQEKLPDHIMVHDSARPFVPQLVINNLINSCSHEHGVVPALPIHDSIKQINENNIIKNINRSSIVRVQTPQIFPFKKLLYAYDNISDINNTLTDDSQIFLDSGFKVKHIEGDLRGLKITTKQDLKILDALI